MNLLETIMIGRLLLELLTVAPHLYDDLHSAIAEISSTDDGKLKLQKVLALAQDLIDTIEAAIK